MRPRRRRARRSVREYVEAGVDEVYVQQIGPDFDGFFTAYEKDVLPALRTV